MYPSRNSVVRRTKDEGSRFSKIGILKGDNGKSNIFRIS